MTTRALASLYDFENRERLFPAVDSRMKFCLLTLTGPQRPARRGAEFVFFALSTADLADDWRRFTLSAEDIALLNPNTRTCATFRSRRDAELTKAIYRRVPVLIREAVSPRPEGEGPGVRAEQNPWGIRFATMFHMSNDSHLFRTREQLEAAGWRLEGNRFVWGGEAPTLNPSPSGGGTSGALPVSLPCSGVDSRSGSSSSGGGTSGALPVSLPPEGEGAGMGALYLPLYEAKLLHQFDHRWATYTPDGDTRDLTDAEKADPTLTPTPRYWVDAREVNARLGDWRRGWLLGFRDIARSTDERTAIFGLLPRVGVGNKIPLLLLGVDDAPSIGCLLTCFNSLAFDYVARQKIGGTTLNFFIVKQFPVLPPSAYTPPLLSFIAPRVLELAYTAWDLQPFAQDVGWDGPPFVWDEDRRFLMRCELDALYFHLYGIARDDADYIMETFPIVERKDIAAHGEYRTKRVILEMYDQMAALGVGQDADRIAAFETWLNPRPASPLVAHPPRE